MILLDSSVLGAISMVLGQQFCTDISENSAQVEFMQMDTELTQAHNTVSLVQTDSMNIALCKKRRRVKEVPLIVS